MYVFWCAFGERERERERERESYLLTMFFMYINEEMFIYYSNTRLEF